MAIYKIKRFSLLQKIKERVGNIHKVAKSHFIDFFKRLKSKFFSFEDNNKKYPHIQMIPQYSNLLYIRTLELATFKDLVKDKNWLKYFPSFQNLILPEVIESYSKDYDYKWTEVMFNYIADDGPEVLMLYDFQDSNWYVKDFTYTPHREYRIKSLKEYLLSMFDPKQDCLMGIRVSLLNVGAEFFSETYTPEQVKKIMPRYLEWHRDIINKIIADD